MNVLDHPTFLSVELFFGGTMDLNGYVDVPHILYQLFGDSNLLLDTNNGFINGVITLLHLQLTLTLEWWLVGVRWRYKAVE